MTQRLYFEDSYLREFDANVLECRKTDEGYAVRLDRTAFYPTSGGQPHDMGTLGAANVTDVAMDSDGELWHTIDCALEVSSGVHGRIDWARRFDHMQQHAGEHLLANALYRLMGGHTIGLHLGAEVSTIDVNLPDGKTHISGDEIRALEDDVNARIQEGAPIRSWFPVDEELGTIPLRKQPAVDEDIRVVQIGELEFCACGGTHPSSAGQIGLFKITDARPSRGKLRIAFVCGGRAFALLREHYEIATAAAEILSTSVGNLPNLVGSMVEQLKASEKACALMRKEQLIARIPEMLARAQISKSGIRVVAEQVEADAISARELATRIAQSENTIAILAADSGGGYAHIACRAADVGANMGEMLSGAAKVCGGKGGGRAEFAQGGGPIEMFERMRGEAIQL
ncbi:MAG: alanyl-tRNA editing protein [Christensenellales bacterium]|jgi:alanyl-tRNA synthetase